MYLTFCISAMQARYAIGSYAPKHNSRDATVTRLSPEIETSVFEPADPRTHFQ
jgi:hypothetical protein